MGSKGDVPGMLVRVMELMLTKLRDVRNGVQKTPRLAWENEDGAKGFSSGDGWVDGAGGGNGCAWCGAGTGNSTGASGGRTCVGTGSGGDAAAVDAVAARDSDARRGRGERSFAAGGSAVCCEDQPGAGGVPAAASGDWAQPFVLAILGAAEPTAEELRGFRSRSGGLCHRETRGARGSIG